MEKVRNKTSLPSPNDLIKFQHADGFWKEDVIKSFKRFLENEHYEDPEVIEELRKYNLNDFDAVYRTLVALFILKEQFPLRETEWMLIAKKAKQWLKE